jgi:hypothetical protein
MTRDTITCRYCGGLIREHHEVFDHIACEAPTPTAEPTPAPTPEAMRHRASRLYWRFKQRGKQMAQQRRGDEH